MSQRKDCLISSITSLLSKKDFVIISIDGRCGAGKTTLANELAAHFAGNLIHMDDFFLQAHQRSKDRLQTPGENVDHERFSVEVLPFMIKNESVSYRVFDCKTKDFVATRHLDSNRLWIVEGSYSMHPIFSHYYDLSIFCDIDPIQQKTRICKRNKASWPAFESKWIPLEESYFAAFSIKEHSDMIMNLV